MKVIFVPPELRVANGIMTTTHGFAEICNQNPQSYVMVDNNPHQVFSSQSYQNKCLTYDPLQDHLSWYAGIDQPNVHEHTHMLGFSSITQKFWHIRELHAWLEENCEDDVLVQRGMGCWNLCFIDRKDRTDFEEWFMRHEKTHSMYVSTDNEDGSDQNGQKTQAEVANWCTANLKGQWTVERAYQGVKLCVKDDTEAVLARLTFESRGKR